MVRSEHHCEICSEGYPTSSMALECESLGTPKYAPESGTIFETTSENNLLHSVYFVFENYNQIVNVEGEHLWSCSGERIHYSLSLEFVETSREFGVSRCSGIIVSSNGKNLVDKLGRSFGVVTSDRYSDRLCSDERFRISVNRCMHVS